MASLLVKNHNFLGENHEQSELRTWMVIYLCSAFCIAEVTCGVLFGSLALVADGIHMFTHAIAFFMSAMAYKLAKKHVDDKRFVFGTAKMGDLGAYSSAIILLVVSLYILYDGISKIVNPEPLDFLNAIPVGCAGLFVNILSGLLLAGVFDCHKKRVEGYVDPGQAHSHCHGHSHGHQQEVYDIEEDEDEGEEANDCGHDHDHSHTSGSGSEHDHEHGHGGHEGHGNGGACDGHDHGHDSAPCSHTSHDSKDVATNDHEHGHGHGQEAMSSRRVELASNGHAHSSLPHSIDAHSHDHESAIQDHSHDECTHGHGDCDHMHMRVESAVAVPTTAAVPPQKSYISRVLGDLAQVGKEKHEVDNNFRASFFHVLADAFVSFLVIIALIVAGYVPSLYWFDPVVGIIGAGVILSWAVQLILDAGANLLDMCPDASIPSKLQTHLERDGSRLGDLHVWRLGPGHLGAVLSVTPPLQRLPGVVYDAQYYHTKMKGYRAISHATIEVC